MFILVYNWLVSSSDQI